jgi:hypothetical protein
LQFLSDNRLDGVNFTSGRFSWSGGYFNNNLNYDYTSYESIIAYGYLFNTDEPYYRYHQSLRNSNNDNPFAEPAPVYSNITGGLGVFAAYNQSVITLQLK